MNEKLVTLIAEIINDTKHLCERLCPALLSELQKRSELVGAVEQWNVELTPQKLMQVYELGGGHLMRI